MECEASCFNALWMMVLSRHYCSVWKGKRLHSPGNEGILCVGMREDAEDLNEFNSWDVLGAMLMMTLVPAVMNYTFNDRDVVGSIVIAGIGSVISLSVFVLSLLTHWGIISKVVNLFGVVLTTLYIMLAVYFWCCDSEDSPTAEPETVTTQQ